MKNIKRTVITAMAVISILAFSACGNVDEVRSERDPAASAATTSAQEDSGTVTTVPMTTTTPRKSSMTTASETEAATTTTVTTANVASEKKTTTTTKVTTTTKKPTTTVTTAKKPAAAATKKTTTTVTTTKKTTTTTPKVTTTKKVTTTAKPAAKLTQKDIDKLVKELQEYSNSKSKWKTEYVNSIWYGKWFNTYEEYCELAVRDSTPSSSSWWSSGISIKPTNNYSAELTECLEYVDFMYSECPNAHIVIYAQWCENGKGNTNTFIDFDCWEMYFLR